MNYSKEDKDALRQNRREQNPEEIQKQEENRTSFSLIEISDLWKSISKRRIQYFKDRNLEKTVLNNDEKETFKKIVQGYYNCADQNIAPYVNTLIVEGLAYPDDELNKFSCDFLRKHEAQEQDVNWSFWLHLWMADYVPLNAVRLMVNIQEENGEQKFYPLDQFKKVSKIIRGSIVKQLETEKDNLEVSQQIEDEKIRQRDVAQNNLRIEYFQKLLSAYQLDE